MTAEIRSWEIVDGQLVPVESRLADHGKTEPFDLESWIASDPSIIRPGLKIVGRFRPGLVRSISWLSIGPGASSSSS